MTLYIAVNTSIDKERNFNERRTTKIKLKSKSKSMEALKPKAQIVSILLLVFVLSNVAVLRVLADGVTSEEAKLLRDEVKNSEFEFLVDSLEFLLEP